jgi:hypothetical protein
MRMLQEAVFLFATLLAHGSKDQGYMRCEALSQQCASYTNQKVNTNSSQILLHSHNIYKILQLMCLLAYSCIFTVSRWSGGCMGELKISWASNFASSVRGTPRFCLFSFISWTLSVTIYSEIFRYYYFAFRL